MRLKQLMTTAIFLALMATLAAQTPTPTPKRPSGDIFRPGANKIHIVADAITGDGPKSHHWGNVQLTVGDITIVADEATSDLQGGEIALSGDVRILMK